MDWREGSRDREPTYFRDGIRQKESQAGKKKEGSRGTEVNVDLSVEVIELLPRQNQRN